MVLLLCSFVNNAWSCNGFSPAVTTNTYIGNGQYLLTIEVCEFVSNGFGSQTNGLMVTVNGANILSVVTPSLYGVSQGLTIFPTTIGTNQVEYGDWGNSAAPVFQADGDPQECWTIELIVDNAAATVDVMGSSSNDVFAPGTGMVSIGGVWTCNSSVAVPPAVCDASFAPPTLCEGSTSQIDLDTTVASTGVWSGPGVNSGTGIFDPTGLTGTISLTFSIGDALFNCSTTEDIVLEVVPAPSLTDSTICTGDFAPLDASVTAPAPPPPPASPCDYSITLSDTWGDGWNGGSVTVLVDGVVQLNAVTLVSGYGPVSYNFSVMPGQTITVNYSGGFYTSENYYVVSDASNGAGSSIFSSTFGLTPAASQAVTNPCTGGAPPASTDCSYELVIEDSYGDGWQGADVDIYINGVLFLLNQTVPNCGSSPCTEYISIPVNDGDVILLNYTGGLFNSENTIFLYDSDGILVNSINNPPNGNLGSGITASCPPTAYSYVWSPPAGLSDPNIADPQATPGSTTVYTVTVTAPGSICTSQSSVTITVDPCALPMDFDSFTGVCLGGEVVFNWMAVTEENTDRFEIEYSQDGMDFAKIGEVQALGDETEMNEYAYSLLEQQDFIGYYKLKQYDVDGVFKESKSITVECENDEVYAFIANNSIVISSYHMLENVRVIDMTGKVIYTGNSNQIDISSHSSAMYFIEVETKESVERLKVIGVTVQ